MMTQPATMPRGGTMADLAPAPRAHALEAFAFDPDGLTLQWDDGRSSRFAAVWLRDNCPCPACRHPQAMERLYMFIDHPPPRILQATRPAPDVLDLFFAQGAQPHQARFDIHWLRQRGAAEAPDGDMASRRVPWDAGLNGAVPTLSCADFMGTPQGLRRWIDAIRTHGIVLLQGVPTVPGHLLEVARRVGPVRATNFGDHYDVISMPDPNAVAYTALGLELHNDLVNWRFPPDVQMLCCLKSSVTGGESLFADGLRVAEDLRAQHPDAFSLLVQQPVEFRFHDAHCDIRHSAPMLALDAQGRLARIRFNNWLRSTLAVPDALVVPMYQAIGRLWTMLRDPRYHLQLRLAPGELIAYDNSRILHGRQPFDPHSGERHLQGCYMNMEDLDSAWRLLDRLAHGMADQDDAGRQHRAASPA